VALPECGDNIDPTTFEQILEMDDDEEEREFSKSIVYGFFEQVESTFEKMDAAMYATSIVVPASLGCADYLLSKTKDLETLSSLGHFLKGSSATLGLNKLKASTEKIQHFGHGKDETGTKDETPEFCLTAIEKEIKKLKIDYVTVEKSLRKFYGE